MQILCLGHKILFQLWVTPQELFHPNPKKSSKCENVYGIKRIISVLTYSLHNQRLVVIHLQYLLVLGKVTPKLSMKSETVKDAVDVALISCDLSPFDFYLGATLRFKYTSMLQQGFKRSKRLSAAISAIERRLYKNIWSK